MRLFAFRLAVSRGRRHSSGGSPGRSRTVREVGQGSEDSDIWITCDADGRHWLHVHYEAEQYTASGHWYEALLDANADPDRITVEDVDDIFKASRSKFIGGSFFDGKVSPYDGLPKRLV